MQIPLRRLIVPVITALALPNDVAWRSSELSPSPGTATTTSPPPAPPPLPFSRSAMNPFRHSLDGMRHFPAYTKGPLHTVDFTFEVTQRGLEGFPKDLLLDSAVVVHQLLKMFGGEFAKLDHDESVNPFYPLSTRLRVDPKVSVVLTPSLVQQMAGLGAHFDLGENNDAATVAVVLNEVAVRSTGYGIQYFVFFDVTRLKMKSAKIAAKFGIEWEDAFLPIFTMTVWHELFGHFPMSLQEKEREDYVVNEVSATQRGIRGFEWYVQFIQTQLSDQVTLRMLRRILAAEQEWLQTLQSEVK